MDLLGRDAMCCECNHSAEHECCDETWCETHHAEHRGDHTLCGDCGRDMGPESTDTVCRECRRDRDVDAWSDWTESRRDER